MGGGEAEREARAPAPAGTLDPPEKASRCDTRFGIAAGEITTVVIVLRGAPGGVAAECSARLE